MDTRLAPPLSGDWQDVVDMPLNHLAYETEDAATGVRLAVRRGPFSLCAYAGVPLGHPLERARREYPLAVEDALWDYHFEWHGDIVPIGLSSAAEMGLDPGYAWWGVDYSHLGDARATAADMTPPWREAGMEWTVPRVVEDSMEFMTAFCALAGAARAWEAAGADPLKMLPNFRVSADEIEEGLTLEGLKAWQ